MATLDDWSGSLPDSVFVPSDALSSQKDTVPPPPLTSLVHHMLQPDIGSHKDVAAVGQIGSGFLAIQVLPRNQYVFVSFA